MNGNLVSVVVPTYNRPDFLERCLEALLAQDFDHTRYEILIVDDANSEKTRKQVAEWSKKTETYVIWPSSQRKAAVQTGELHTESTLDERSNALVRFTHAPTIRYIPMQVEHGPAAARNAGWINSAGQIIAFTDDDCVPTKGWLSAGVKAIENGAEGVSGKILMPISLNPTDYERNAAGLERSEFVTANCFYRRQALEMAGGFDTRFKVAWREDTDLYFTMIEKGNRLVTAPDAIVVHPVRPAPWGISLRQQEKSQYNALLYKKHPKLYREFVQAGAPWRYYFTVIALLGIILGIFLDITPLSGLSAGLWLGLTGSFAMQRLKDTSHSPEHVIEMIATSAIIPPLSVFWRLRGALKFKVKFI